MASKQSFFTEEFRHWVESWDKVTDIFFKFEELKSSGMDPDRAIHEIAHIAPNRIDPKQVKLYVKMIDRYIINKSIAMVGCD